MSSRYHRTAVRECVPVSLYVPPQRYAQLLLAARDYAHQIDNDATEKDQVDWVVNGAIAYWLKHRAEIEAAARADYERRAAETNGTAMP